MTAGTEAMKTLGEFSRPDLETWIKSKYPEVVFTLKSLDKPVAAALHADALVIMTNVPGLLADPQDANTLIRTIPADQLEEYMSYAKGRMRKKLLGAQEALQGNVSRVCIGSESLRAVVEGSGTVITHIPVMVSQMQEDREMVPIL